MFTNNYIELKKMLFGANSSANFKTTANQQQTGYRAAAYLGEIGAYLENPRFSTLPETYSSGATPAFSGVYFGSGSTPATKNDYKLESQITSGVSVEKTSGLYLITDDPDVYTYAATYTLKNTSSSDVVIYEIGVITGIYPSSSFTPNSTSNTWYPVLMDRVVLTEPITIPVGGMKSVTYKVTFNQTLNVEQ